MTKQSKQTMTWSAVLLTICGAILLILLIGMLFIRYRAVETELDRMLNESLTAHTVEAGDGAGYLIHYAETAMKNANLLLQEEAAVPEKSLAELTVKTFNLVDDRMELSYLDAGELTAAPWGQAEPELLRAVQAGNTGISGLIFQPDEEEYVVVLQPVEWKGQVWGVLQTKISALTLLQQGQHSTFFHSVHSVIAGADGQVVFGGVTGGTGQLLEELSDGNDITDADKQAFSQVYQTRESGSFNYEPRGGRCYAAWAPIGYNDWRIVQFSQSPNVQIERSSMVQTGVMLISLVVCAVLAAMIWRQRAKLAEEKLRYDALAQFKDTLLFEYDCANDTLEFTSNALETLALDTPRLTGVIQNKNIASVFHPDEIEKECKILQRASHMTPDQIEHDRIRMKRRNGDYSWYRSQYRAVYNPNGKVIRVIGTLTDISAQIVRELELRQQAQQDPLTGLYNRAGVKLIDARLEQISRGILFMLDLDDFKSINDTYGHAAGDQVLIAIGNILDETFRTDDIVARVGGDEFVAFLSGSDNEGMAREKAQELLDRVHDLKIEGIDHTISVSIGISSAPTHGRTYESLSSGADKAMYKIKNEGKGSYSIL